jgi:hypothetical protein
VNELDVSRAFAAFGRIWPHLATSRLHITTWIVVTPRGLRKTLAVAGKHFFFFVSVCEIAFPYQKGNKLTMRIYNHGQYEFRGPSYFFHCYPARLPSLTAPSRMQAEDFILRLGLKAVPWVLSRMIFREFVHTLFSPWVRLVMATPQHQTIAPTLIECVRDRELRMHSSTMITNVPLSKQSSSRELILLLCNSAMALQMHVLVRHTRWSVTWPSAARLIAPPPQLIYDYM